LNKGFIIERSSFSRWLERLTAFGGRIFVLGKRGDQAKTSLLPPTERQKTSLLLGKEKTQMGRILVMAI
jgi:hypothetical protein